MGDGDCGPPFEVEQPGVQVTYRGGAALSHVNPSDAVALLIPSKYPLHGATTNVSLALCIAQARRTARPVLGNNVSEDVFPTFGKKWENVPNEGQQRLQ